MRGNEAGKRYACGKVWIACGRIFVCLEGKPSVDFGFLGDDVDVNRGGLAQEAVHYT